RDDVALVRLDQTVTLPPDAITEVARPLSGEPEWGVARIQADEVWRTLDIDGSGVVVANIDTGVDYQHPDLQTRYRGYRGGALPPLHAGNWFDATGAGALYPVDDNGHGTHTIGTIVGAGGIGVAPGARWMAVKAFDKSGAALESWLHRAFEWILAPDGDPALAPNAVNNSWSTRSGGFTGYETDVQLLLDAGIVPIFSAGNGGPDGTTTGAPASYNSSIAVGATDPDDDIAYFSSRGPSPWGKVKPDVSAPGVQVVSTLPGGRYGASDGTSMAAPHVTGLVALLKQANSSLTYPQITQILTGTATPLGSNHPNNNFGWGLVNAYAAAQLAANAGQVEGRVTDRDTGLPLAGAAVTITPKFTGVTAAATTGSDGLYRRGIPAGDYNITAAAFGYTPHTEYGVTVITGTVITRNFALTRQPAGTISGTITGAATGLPLSATIAVNRTPVTATADAATGKYSLSLPGGSYTLTVTSPGHRIGVAANVPVTAGKTSLQNVSLITAPTILLVDTGAWYYGSQIDFYRRALDDLRYHYDDRRVKLIPDEVPDATALSAYDVVIWSSPLDSPGYVGANPAIAGFLDNGGNLILSGQDVAYYDGGGTIFLYAPYYSDYLKARFAADDAGTDAVLPVPGEIFDGLSLTISGGDGAGNQERPDVIRLTDLAAADQTLTYATGGNAGQRIGHCLPYRAVNVPFGLEAINSRQARAQVLEAALNWFQSPPVQHEFQAAPFEHTEVGPPGTTVTHTVRIFNRAESGPADTYTITLGAHNWPTTPFSTAVTLEPCRSADITITVDIPSVAGWDARDVLTVTVQPTLSPTARLIVTRTSKAPAPVLLVDDDRWYEYDAEFIRAFNAAGVHSDYWDIPDTNRLGTPPLEVLQRYPAVVWFTGYDGFQPLTTAEEHTLKQYLDGGGRLALTSQEYLYVLPGHTASDFARAYFGIDSHSEALTSTEATGVAGNPVGDGLGPYPFTFAPIYQNWTDAVTPTASARAAMVGQHGYANALTNMGTATHTWRTAFFGFGLELLSDPDRAELARRISGWLSWLGNSTITPGAPAAAGGDTVTYTAVLRNDGLAPIATAAFTATFPPPLSLVPGSAGGGAVERDGNVTWSGPLPQNGAITLTYRALVDPAAPYGTLSRQVSQITLRDHSLTFDRAGLLPVNIPDWSQSTLTVSPTRVSPGGVLTYTLRLVNSGVAAAPDVLVTGTIPPHLAARPFSVTVGTGSLGSGQIVSNTLRWRGPVARDSVFTLTFSAQVISVRIPFTFPLTLFADDGYSADNRWTATAWVEPFAAYLPLIIKP
ncbi:MAG: S8 family serine peptidase, partial [Anaerolineae bacterium]